MDHAISRRAWLGRTPAALGAGAWVVASATGPASADDRPRDEPFGYCLNTSTIRGQSLSIDREAELVARAGFQGIEPWIRELDAYTKGGGSLDALGRRFRDLGLSIPSVIGFFEWVVDDPARRRKGFDEARRNFEIVRAIGGQRLAAPPVGATDRADLDLNRVAERYRELLKLGDEFGVVPQAEVWGFSKTLGRLADAAHVAIAADHPRACILPDVYHLYKGGSGFQGLRLLSKDAFHVIHINDYPDNPPRATITDADRVYPGDGVAPLGRVFRALDATGFRGMLSIELFNKAYYQAEASEVLRTGLNKLRAAVRQGLAEERPGG